ncbi:hypothetical protein AJ78_04876 [Emergomyces pasteurianus Ep9510]|uniref:Uncharacterized protein n=1 Tax=Emergomyces pasteurianus Ep9510 TaxID=1447872 RepID=A0A1J9QFW6_9EURO|nr:hypothetical protein AJ78_04876 [Emergomyces pasteurianus Ep9510]
MTLIGIHIKRRFLYRVPKLFSFAKECEKERSDTMVQENKASSHDHCIQHHVYTKDGMMWEFAISQFNRALLVMYEASNY